MWTKYLIQLEETCLLYNKYTTSAAQINSEWKTTEKNINTLKLLAYQKIKKHKQQVEKLWQCNV